MPGRFAASIFFGRDANLGASLRRRFGLSAESEALLADFGAWVGSAVDEEAEYTDRFARPTLAPYDEDGRMSHRISHNRAWRDVSRELYRRGFVGLNYGPEPEPYWLTLVMGYLLSQADVSLHCPATMTSAVASVLAGHSPAAVLERYLPELIRRDGLALTGGTWATERHGGSDVGATTTCARAVAGGVALSGLKWFARNPDGGLALATARPAGADSGWRGLGLYLVPLVHDDDRPNGVHIRRLKSKLGTCGVATGELELDDAFALEGAPPPQGFRLMMEALEFSRLHNVMASVGVARRAFLEAVAYCAERAAFGERIDRFPMVQQELLTILARTEADLGLALEAAAAFEARHRSASDASRTWLRLVTALAKYQTAENANRCCRAALEVIGGNAYTDDLIVPRLLRDAQMLTVWEGPANIQALELLRTLDEQREGFAAFVARCEHALEGAPAALSAAMRAALTDCAAAVGFLAGKPTEARRHARQLLGFMADVLAAALLCEEAVAGIAQVDGRKALIARLFIEAQLARPPRRGMAPGADWAEPHFDALIDFRPISAGSAAAFASSAA